MQLLKVQDEWAQYLCDCGTEFTASPAPEENVFFDEHRRALVPQCPKCKRPQDKVAPATGCVFVFGSNLAGRHGAGAARVAHIQYGAQMGNGVGFQGSSYAIPTKDEKLVTLALKEIFKHVDDFLQFAIRTPGVNYFVTRIGCGLAGYTDRDIAPRFKHAPRNCDLPYGWRNQTPPW